MVIVSVHQPQYLPWLGFLDRIARSDIFVLLDSVAYSKNYFYNRNRIKTANGWIWLTIPVLSKGRFGEKIKDVRINNEIEWEKKHLKSIFHAYHQTPFFCQYKQALEKFYDQKWDYLSEASIASINLMVKFFGIGTKLIRSSELKLEGAKEQLLINICLRLGTDTYLSGPDGRNYINLDNWKKAGIEVRFQEFKHPKYPQLFGDFIPQMTALDMLFNCGQNSLDILLDSRQEYADLVLK